MFVDKCARDAHRSWPDRSGRRWRCGSTSAQAERGRDGHLDILYWQAALHASIPYLSGGIKDIEAASLVLEPLARYDENGDHGPGARGAKSRPWRTAASPPI